MLDWWKIVRKIPYTVLGIKRKKCIRCGGQATQQWQICSDGNNYRPICIRCDIKMNKIILDFIRMPGRSKREMIEKYGSAIGPRRRRAR